MNWYRENRWLGNFLIAFGAVLLLALWFLLHAKSAFADASAQFNDAATERSRLEHLNPFPNEENFRKTGAALDNYSATLNKLKDELRTQTLPIAPLAPNEFQSRLQQAIVSTTEKARGNRVKLPENFHLGFDEFTTALPGSAATAALLGQELGQVELLLGTMIDGHVDAITNVKRGTLPPETVPVPLGPAASTPATKPSGVANAGRAVVERSIVNLTFTASPSVMRKVLNQIASSERQFFIVRTLYVWNEQPKGPSREQTGATKAAETAATTANPTNAIKFIVGNEHVETTARIELIRFAF
jgi:hypothetical protein